MENEKVCLFFLQKKQDTLKMRVAVIFLLQIFLGVAFKIETKKPLLDEKLDGLTVLEDETVNKVILTQNRFKGAASRMIYLITLKISKKGKPVRSLKRLLCKESYEAAL